MTGMLDGRAAIVTGAGAGIGRGVAKALATEGARVAVMGRRAEPLESVCAEISSLGGEALAVQGDVGVLEDLQRCIDSTVDTFGRLDILVNNAQGYRHANLLDATDDDMELVWKTGPLAAFRSMRLAHPHLAKQGGVIVNFGSGCQIDPMEKFHGVYTAGKNAIEALTRVAAVEWGPDGIRTLLIMPAAESDQLAAFRARDPERYAQMLERIPAGRFGDPEQDIGVPIAFLVSDRASYMSGTTIMLDGGQMQLR